MARESAGLLMYRVRQGGVEFLLVHPGGPFWKTKDAGSWTIPKGEISAGENPFDAAVREFEEELGFRPEGEFAPLGSVKQKSGKTVQAWAFAGDCDPAQVRSNTFRMEWPPKSGKFVEFPEVDRAAFFTNTEARARINPAQIAFLDRVIEKLKGAG